MEYLDSTHFSDKISYKILFISSYGSKDMNLAKFKYLQQFSENRRQAGSFLTHSKLAAEADAWGQVADLAADETRKQRWHRFGLTSGGHLSESKNKKGHLTTAQDKFRTQDLQV
jgi:hypothetical protein